MTIIAFDRSGTPPRAQVEARDGGVCAECGMDTEYVKALCGPYLAEACTRQAAGDMDRAVVLRLKVVDFLNDLGFSRAVVSASINRWGGVIDTHLWEADHIIPVVNGGGGECGLENLRTLCRACHHKATARLARARAKEKRIACKNLRHAERMAAKRTRLLP